jgi:hypothetical protein
MNQLRDAMNWAMSHVAPAQPPPAATEIHWVHTGHRTATGGPPDRPEDSDDF